MFKVFLNTNWYLVYLTKYEIDFYLSLQVRRRVHNNIHGLHRVRVYFKVRVFIYGIQTKPILLVWLVRNMARGQLVD